MCLTSDAIREAICGAPGTLISEAISEDISHLISQVIREVTNEVTSKGFSQGISQGCVCGYWAYDGWLSQGSRTLGLKGHQIPATYGVTSGPP